MRPTRTAASFRTAWTIRHPLRLISECGTLNSSNGGIGRWAFEEHRVIAIETNELVTTAVAAKRLGVSARRVLQLVHAGQLRATKVIDGVRDQHVFASEDIDRFAEQRKARKAGVR